jgi:hypothetical protein
MIELNRHYDPNHIIGLAISLLGILVGLACFLFGFRWLENSLGGGITFEDLEGVAFISFLVSGGLVAHRHGRL